MWRQSIQTKCMEPLVLNSVRLFEGDGQEMGKLLLGHFARSHREIRCLNLPFPDTCPATGTLLRRVREYQPCSFRAEQRAIAIFVQGRRRTGEMIADFP